MAGDGLAARLARQGLRFMGYWLLNCYFSRPELRNARHLGLPGPKVIAANHMGDMFDPVILWTYAGRELDGRLSIPGKKEIFRLDPFGVSNAFFRMVGGIPVDRENPGNIIDGFVKALENGGRYDGTLSIHFEGKSTPRGELVAKAKTGFARAALRLPEERRPRVIPASISYHGGIYHCLPAFRSHPVVEFLEPIDVLPWKRAYGTYDPARGESEAQHRVAQDLTGLVKRLVVEDLQRKGFKASPGITGIY
jgi:1-acyl-sn-glycerol-3-phosphate acyltransferase